MEKTGKRFVKVRLNASGKRIIGIVAVPPPHFRVSDYLNSHEDFLRIGVEDSGFFVPKGSISYLEALEEGSDAGSRPKRGSFHQVTVTLGNHAGTFSGEVFVPEESDLAATLARVRRFLSVRNVRFSSTVERYGFLAVGKTAIICIQEGRGRV